MWNMRPRPEVGLAASPVLAMILIFRGFAFIGVMFLAVVRL